MGFTIKELESLSGIKAHTIRIWEQRYRFLKPSRTTTNIRIYNNEELKTLLTVALLNKYGYKISRIDDMPSEQRNRTIMELPAAEAQNEQQVNELITAMMDLRIGRFEQILSSQIAGKGIFETITTVLFRFLEKTGILWQTGRIHPAHEHIVSNIIRQKLIAAIEILPANKAKNLVVLLLLPEHEYHELGLLFVYYILKQRGFSIIYLGANVPLKDANYIIGQKKPAFIYMHLTSLRTKLNFHKFIAGIEKHPQLKVLLSGSAIERFEKNTDSRIIVLKSLSNVLTYISSL